MSPADRSRGPVSAARVLACVLEGLGGLHGEDCARMWCRVSARYLEVENSGFGMVSDLRMLGWLDRRG